MRNLFGVSQDALLLGLVVLTVLVVGVLGTAAWRNPLLPRLAWRNVPRRPGFAALITLGQGTGQPVQRVGRDQRDQQHGDASGEVQEVQQIRYLSDSHSKRLKLRQS